MLRTISAVFVSLCIAKPCWSDLPLSIEDLLTEKNEFRVEFGLNYANADRKNLNTRFDSVQVGPGSFILLPVDVRNQRQNSDVFALTLGARYGITDKTEIYSRLTALAEDIRTQDGTETDNSSSQLWHEFVLGINHQFSEENDTPALLGFAEISAIENTDMDKFNFVYGKSGQIGFTTYRSIDPVVLSLTAGYRYAGSRNVDGQKIDPGDLLFINPSLGFAINNKVTVSGGALFRFRGKDKVTGDHSGMRTSQTDLGFGLGYAASKDVTLHFNILSDISGDTGAQTGFNLIYKM